MTEPVEGIVLAAVIESLVAVEGPEVPTDCLDDWGVPYEPRELARRYATHPEAAYDPTVVAWLLANCGEMAPDVFEMELGRRIGYDEYCAPVWVLSRRIAQRRLPARPAVPLGDPVVAQAYAGLLDLVARYDHAESPELQRTALVWRVGALADGMEPVDSTGAVSSPLAGRIQQLVDQLKNDSRLTFIEVQACGKWEPSRFSDRRNVLTHLSNPSIRFADACTYYEDEEKLTTECEAVSLAVLRRVADVMLSEKVPGYAVRRLEADIGWIQ